MNYITTLSAFHISAYNADQGFFNSFTLEEGNDPNVGNYE